MNKMEHNSEEHFLQSLTEEERKLHEEFMRCETQEDIDAFFEKVEKYNESRKNQEIPYYDMTIEEYRKKFHTTSYEEMKKRMCGECD